MRRFMKRSGKGYEGESFWIHYKRVNEIPHQLSEVFNQLFEEVRREGKEVYSFKWIETDLNKFIFKIKTSDGEVFVWEGSPYRYHREENIIDSDEDVGEEPLMAKLRRGSKVRRSFRKRAGINHWVITKDYLDNDMVGTTSIDFPLHLRMEDMPITFRLYDGDRNLYYEGRMTEFDFAPLDDFGEGYAGCVSLKYLENGRWVEL